ncbi:MAG TPA: malto-oligosyltrehalose synthase [Gammaproteobacteria bacterium]
MEESEASRDDGTSPPVAEVIPRATYRLQLHSRFTFLQAAQLVPYLDALGISHCFSSPYLKARPGSTHGYDVVNHRELNPEIGTRSQFNRLCRELKNHGMKQLLDIVPNHMGVMGSDNALWLEMLENGRATRNQFFDIHWDSAQPSLRGKVLLPILGDHYGTVLERGEIQLSFDTDKGSLQAHYYEHTFPLDPQTYPLVLAYQLKQLEPEVDSGTFEEYQNLIDAFKQLPQRDETSREGIIKRLRNKELYKRRLAALCTHHWKITRFINRSLKAFNSRTSAAMKRLHALLDLQAFRLSYFQVAADEINYRRFFDINTLAGLRVERREVFEKTHSLILKLIEDDRVHGLRIDHPDGLFNPPGYFEQLRKRVNEVAPAKNQPFYIVAEKILIGDEHLPDNWAIDGTTGYEFAHVCNGLFVYDDAEREIDDIYANFTGRSFDFDELVYNCKKQIIENQLASELTMLSYSLNDLAQQDLYTRDFTLLGLRRALAEVTACLPIYRTYPSTGALSEPDQAYVKAALNEAKRRSQATDITIYDFVGEILLGHDLTDKPPTYQAEALRFAMAFQQYTAPVMAKGLEDTALYIYNRLLSLNDVGSHPAQFGVSLDQFHDANRYRLTHWPHAMLTTSTHDTKRSEDVRARINVLSELYNDWQQHLQRWLEINQAGKRFINGQAAPSRNDEYHLYQILVGVWPLEPVDHTGLNELRERVGNYMLKAVREAKVHTSWLNINEEYEQAVADFVAALLSDVDNAFLADFIPFQRRVSHFGMLNSLSQTVLKLCVPGVPDIYQGNEIWMFNLVDPDNRRPVDYEHRQMLLKTLREQADGDTVALIHELMDNLPDGRAKLYLTWRLLNWRRQYPQLFESGDYEPLYAEGEKSEHICAFLRQHRQMRLIVIAPRWYARLTQDSSHWLSAEAVWGDTHLNLPQGRYRNLLTNETLDAGEQTGISQALLNFPVAVLVNE